VNARNNPHNPRSIIGRAARRRGGTLDEIFSCTDWPHIFDPTNVNNDGHTINTSDGNSKSSNKSSSNKRYTTMTLSLVWMLMLIPASIAAFVQNDMDTLKFAGRNTFASRRFASSTLSVNGDITRNIFHDYQKPLVLIGKSSEKGNELGRLADHVATKLDSASSSIITIDKVSANDILQGIEGNVYTWPQVIVLDYLSASADAINGMARDLYNANLLSIYVNVERSDNNNEQKAMIERDVILPYTDYELCIRNEGILAADSDEWQHIEWELDRLLGRARLVAPIPGDTSITQNTAHLTMGTHTFFLSLSFPNITMVEPYVEQMCTDVDAMEYRTDLLECRDNRFDLLYGMQLLRRYCRPHVTRVPALPIPGSVLEDVMPIVYTVRTRNQAGTYPDDLDGISKMFELLELGLRGGVEVLDVESAWNQGKTERLLDLAEQRYTSQILGSHHVVGEFVTTEDAVHLFEQCSLGGRAHGAKVVLSIESDENDRMAYEAALISSELARQEGRPVIPHVSLILGDVGQFSRVINLPFTPVTHESLPVKAAPGQMTANEIMATRLLTNIFQRKQYAILGHNIAYSVSPQMHGAAFAATKLAHTYARADVETVEEFIKSDFWQADDFGGTSVTIPHKQAIIPYVDVMSDAAKAIGSVNTIIVREEFVDDDFKRIVYGDNTDWRGIYTPLNRLLGSTVDSERDYALILGAGGTARAAAYVAKKLGLRPIYYNRTPSKARELADEFGGSIVDSLDEEGAGGGGSDESLGSMVQKDKGRIRVVISTLPAAAKFQLPAWTLQPELKPIIFDVNYKPYTTALIAQAEASSCKVVRGSEMLWEQGVGQFELWTGRTAPYGVMKSVVLENCIDT
jgi:shikimate-5-dehydrogenase/3-dehydroquinate dehydratase type I